MKMKDNPNSANNLNFVLNVQIQIIYFMHQLPFWKYVLLITASFFFIQCSAQKVSQASPTQQSNNTVTNHTPNDYPLNLKDIWQSSKYASKHVYGLNNLNDGRSYSEIDYSGSYPAIVQYSFENGQKIQTLFDGQAEQLNFSDYTFSDDETKLLLATETQPIYRHSTRSVYYVFDRNNSKLTPIADKKSISYPTFSPQGGSVAYVYQNNIYIQDLSNGIIKPVTNNGQANAIINGMSDWVYEEEFVLTRAYEWSPDGQHIAFLSFDERQVPQYTLDFYGSLYPQPYTFKYPKAGEPNSIVSPSLYSVSTGQTTSFEIAAWQDSYIPRIYWTPNNELMLFELNRHQNHLKIYQLNPAEIKARLFFEEENPFYFSETILDEVSFLKSGDFIWSSERDGFYHLYLYNKEGQLKNQITSGQWDVTELYGVDEANEVVYFQAAKSSPMNREVYKIQLDGSNLKKLSTEVGTNNAQFTKTFDLFVNEYSSTTTPLITSINNNEGQPLRVLESNDALKQNIAALKSAKASSPALPQTEFFQFNTVDGTSLNGWMLKPVDFDPNKKYAVLMYVYGGPGSQTVLNSWANAQYWWHAYLTQQDIIVVSVDNRGTGARGQAFKKATYLNLGKLEGQDQRAAAQYLAKQPYIDGERIGIWGWSYGGFMSSNCIFQSNDVFSLAVSVAPVTNWRYYDSIYTERYMRTPQENAAGYDDNSPITHAQDLNGKYLLIHGMADDNVHFQNTVDLVTALNQADKQYDLGLYPNKNHGIYGGNTRYQLFQKITDFILENL